jgi:hypothetical protein
MHLGERMARITLSRMLFVVAIALPSVAATR